MAAYYSLRAKHGVGLILTEGVIVHHSGDGYNNVPHIETAEQTDSWKQVVNRVHEHGGKIACQLWHCGRISHEDYTGGTPPISSTNTAASGINRQNDKPFGQPRSMSGEDFKNVTNQFVNAATNAFSAGFDAVQLHLGHGYLADQFLDANVNDRIDEYGGSVENRCRFPLDITRSVINAIGAERVIVRISPSRFMGAVYDWPDLDEMISYLIPRLDQLGIRFLDISCANADYFQTSGRVIRAARKLWPHVIIGGASLSPQDAESEISSGLIDLVTWGRALIANYDLVDRFKHNMPYEEFCRDMLAELV
jgi:2,4-dienoyl-CoA reductase-like NADH-dependent reductase (Old Yellow Enzyme family)